MEENGCRACHGTAGSVVLDLGEQPPCGHFPPVDDPGPDPVYPLQMWLCSRCGLAQLLADPSVPEEPRGVEPTALAAQAADAVERVARAGLLPAGSRIVEYGSPHGGSWLGMLTGRGLVPADDGPADVIVDCFGLMHAADQSGALAERAARVAPGGVLLLQYHPLSTIIRCGQWNTLRHGHYAYYSTTALTAILSLSGLRPRAAWQFDLYGGTVLLAASRAADGYGVSGDTIESLLADDTEAGIGAPPAFSALQRRMRTHAASLHDWLVAERTDGNAVLGYGAASRAVALLRCASVDRMLLPAVVDASPAKQGRRMPGTDIPVVGPGQLTAFRPVKVLVLLADLMSEARDAFPEVEEFGGHWVDIDSLS